MNTLTQLTNSITNPFKKKKDPAKDLKKTKPAENKQEVQQPRRLNINTETQLEAMDKQVEREQNFKRINVGGFAAREYTNPDGARLVTQDYAAQGKLGDMNQQPSPSSSFSSITVDNTQNRSKAETDPSDLTDPNSEDVQINAIRNQGLRAARDPKVLETLGIEENDIYQSRDDQFRDRADIQNARAGLQAEELDLLEEEEIARLEQMQQQVAGAIGANRASFSQSREGVQSASVNMVRNQFEQEINKQLDARVKRHKHLLKDIGFKRRELEAAKKQGLTDLAEGLAEDLAAAQQELRSNEIQYVDALGRQIDQQLKVDNQMMQKFEFTYGMMARGQQFSQDQLISMANEFGLPAEMMLSTYQSLEQVRNDKTLDQQQKQLQTQEILRDSQMRSLGYFTEQQQSAKMFMDMYQSGKIDKQQLGEMFAMSNIPSTFNPLTQAELAMQQAELQIQQRRLSGQPVGFGEMREYYDRQIELMDLNGELMGYQPTQSLAGINMFYQNGEMVLDTSSLEKTEFQCGEFVNRTWGLASGGPGGFADSYESKLDMIDIPVEIINENNIIQTVRPGMAFVMPAGGDVAQYGHVGIVSKVYPDGTFDTIEANAPGDTIVGNIVNKRRSIEEVDGFTKPPVGKAEPVGGQKAIQEDINASQAVVFNAYDGKKIPETWQGSPEDFQQQYQKFLDIQSDPKTDLSTVIKMSAGGKPMNDKPEQKMESFSTVANNLQLLEESLQNIDSDKLAPVLGLLEQGNPWDTDRVLVDNAITSIVPGLARGVYGEVGVLTDADVERYRKLLPTYRNTEQQRELVLDMLKTSLYQGVKSTVRTQAANGKDVSRYTYLVDYVKPQDQLQAPNDLDIYSQIESGTFDISQDPQFTSELDNALNSIFE